VAVDARWKVDAESAQVPLVSHDGSSRIEDRRTCGSQRVVLARGGFGATPRAAPGTWDSPLLSRRALERGMLLSTLSPDPRERVCIRARSSDVTATGVLTTCFDLSVRYVPVIEGDKSRIRVRGCEPLRRKHRRLDCAVGEGCLPPCAGAGRGRGQRDRKGRTPAGHRRSARCRSAIARR
jgi:hypothetical protein